MLSSLSELHSEKTDGQEGRIITFDPNRTSFKNAFIVIAFSAMFLEARIFMFARQLLGKDEALRIDKLPYENRLKKLGVDDSNILEKAESFRLARKQLVHEKAMEIDEQDKQTNFTAQTVASEAFELISKINQRLNESP